MIGPLRRRDGRGLAVAIALVAALLALGACSGGGLSVSDAWVTGAPAGGTSAAYLQITNTASSPDALVSATSVAAGQVMIHHTSTDASGMTQMEPMDRVEVPGGATVALDTGGTHIMLMDLQNDLTVGATVELRLIFEHAGTVVVNAAVR
jgi:copper(I)-binding protein